MEGSRCWDQPSKEAHGGLGLAPQPARGLEEQNHLSIPPWAVGAMVQVTDQVWWGFEPCLEAPAAAGRG